MTPRCNSRSAGFTLIEIMIALALLTLIGAQAFMVMRSAGEYSKDESAEMMLEDQTRAVLDRIVYAIMSTHRETLLPESETPLHTDELAYQVKLGVQDGVVVWDDPEMIGLPVRDTQLVWSRNPGTELERRVVWSNIVSPYLEGEIENGIDDNGNGLVDEKGLAFVIDGNSVTIRLSLNRRGSDGKKYTKTVETVATCRNLGGAEDEDPGKLP